MKASVVSRSLKALVVGERQPAFLWGGPGIGKSSVVAQVANSLHRSLQDVRALLLDPVDARTALPGTRWKIQVGNAGVSAYRGRGHPVSG